MQLSVSGSHAAPTGAPAHLQIDKAFVLPGDVSRRRLQTRIRGLTVSQGRAGSSRKRPAPRTGRPALAVSNPSAARTITIPRHRYDDEV
jgi:hypothetical protein